jgi:integrase/recombinase XerD
MEGCVPADVRRAEHHRAIGSHFERHFATTCWRIKQGLDRPLLRYIWSDRAEGETILDWNGIDEYLHTYYEDIEGTYREGVFKIAVS